MSLAAGAKFGPYEITAPLGAGGMGEVYRAHDARLGRDVALKVLPASLTADAERLRRFDQEARATGQLNHPNILQVFDTGTHDGAPYVVAELLEGETLRERIGATPLPVRKAIEYATQVAKGLAAAHEKGIVHRDLKPDNLFVTRDGRVKILDFGLAKLREVPSGEGSHAPTATNATDAGQVLGTVGYMSPEQVRAQPADHRSDIFSFGAVLYEMLSGRRAFHAGSSIETMNAILKEDPPSLSATNRTLPPALERIVGHCLEKSPEERFQSARDIAFDLEQLSGVSETTTVPALGGGRSTPSRRAVLAGAGLLLLGGGIALGVLFGGMGRKKPVVPSFTRVTFQRELISQARFAPDGRSVVYESFVGSVRKLLVAQVERPEYRALDIEDAALCGLSSQGELAVRLQRGPGKRTLARMPMAGGAPRDVLDGVDGCDWNPSGSDLAILRSGLPQSRIEFPAGKVLYSAAQLRTIRMSPKGDRIAFTEHPVANDNRGDLAMVDLAGKRTTLSADWTDLGAIAWSRDGNEVYFSGSRLGSDHSVHAVDMSGRERLVYTLPGSVDVADVSPEGELLLILGTGQPRIFGRAPGAAAERELSWLDFGITRSLSRDGKTLLFDEEGLGGGSEYTAYLRGTDGSPPVRLGTGAAQSLSPDGKWVLVLSISAPAHASLLPTGAGARRELPPGPIAQFHVGAFVSDSKRVMYFANEAGHQPRLWEQNIDGGEPVPVTAEGENILPSFDLEEVATFDAGTVSIRPLSGGPARVVPGLSPNENFLNFTADRRFLIVRGPGPQPAKLFKVDVVTGQRTPFVEFGPPESAGGRITSLHVTDDGKAYAYTHRDPLNTLYVAEGLK